MKAFQAWFVIAGILYIIGALFAISPIQPTSRTTTITIPQGQFFYTIRFDMLPGGSIAGNYAEFSGHSVNLYILDQTQYSTYLSQGQSQSLFATSGASGDFSTGISGIGRYTIVIAHGAGNELLSQDVRITYHVIGDGPVSLAIGLVSIGVAVAFSLLGRRAKRKVESKPEAPSKSDVVLFDQPSSPTQ